MKRSVQVEEALRGLNWGNFCLCILISTGGLNTRWLSHVDFVVKPPLAACAISWIQFLHI